MSDKKTLKVWEVKLYGEEQPRTIEADTCSVGPLWSTQCQTNRAEFWRDNELVAVVPVYEMIRCLGEATCPEPPPCPCIPWRRCLDGAQAHLLQYALERCEGRGSEPSPQDWLVRHLSRQLDEYERRLNCG
ncbi:MAG TPA: hypothetical protein VM537_26945 [Anaerolineae bacterium]|nr:hypothetical protein [Anaerolineae bacterium]